MFILSSKTSNVKLAEFNPNIFLNSFPLIVASPIFMSSTVPPLFLLNILTSSVILFPKLLFGIDF